MEDSILITIRNMIGGFIESESVFDSSLVIFINSALSVLTQLGVGPENGFRITGVDETWDDFLTNDNPERLEMVKEFVFLRVKMMFDAPSVGGVINAYKERIDELTWRLNVAVDPKR